MIDTQRDKHTSEYPGVTLPIDMVIEVTAPQHSWANLAMGTHVHLEMGIVQQAGDDVVERLVADGFMAVGKYLMDNDALSPLDGRDVSIPLTVGQYAALYAYWSAALQTPGMVPKVVPAKAVPHFETLLDRMFEAREEAAKQLAEAEQ